jgi:TRAP-type C4-dicarboxylate transport system substrate-binding protein
MKRLACALLFLSATASADPIVLRFATAAPEGTGWARMLHDYSADIEANTHGAVKMKWYLGAITGDEVETLSRVQKGQLDGIGSGGMACERVIPSMKITRLIAVFQSREEATFVARKLDSTFAEEARQAGFALLGVNGMGADVVFSNRPLRTLAELRKARLWRWDIDETANRFAREMGMTVVARSLEEAAPSYDRGDLEGFVAIPPAALAFQWTTRARYVTDLKIGYLWGCLMVANRAFDRIPVEHQQVVRAASVKLGLRWDDFGAAQDAALLGPLAKQQGLMVTTPSESFRAELFHVAGEVRNRIGGTLVPPALLDRVMRLLADYRAEHAAAR